MNKSLKNNSIQFYENYLTRIERIKKDEIQDKKLLIGDDIPKDKILKEL